MIQLDDIRIDKNPAPRVVAYKAMLENASRRDGGGQGRQESCVELVRLVVENEEGLCARAVVHARLERGRVQFILTTKKNDGRVHFTGMVSRSETVVDAMADWRL